MSLLLVLSGRFSSGGRPAAPAEVIGRPSPAAMSSPHGAGLHWVEATAGADVGEGGVGRYDEVLPCDVGGLVADLATVDLVSRLALRARRDGCYLLLQRVSPELAALLHLAGVDAVLMAVPGAVLEGDGQPEEREELRVEEGRDLGHPPV
jgi:hypothetical protein